ncbi:muscle M-line assembly protein unc-89-like [Clytia hemisphaerica]|uniref:muscle M-line assembly protein unc-89-like n=1 Tax=Clytia hemisphaerica TaxID=252671 RepID=UPI0034D57327
MLDDISGNFIRKIVLGYLSRQKLDATYGSFMRETQLEDQNDNFLQELNLLPSLEDILIDYFTQSNGNKNQDRTFALWKQLDVTLSQLRLLTLGADKAKAYLRLKRSKKTISVDEYRDLQHQKSQQLQPKPVCCDKDVQTDCTLNIFTTHEYSSSVQPATSHFQIDTNQFTPQKEDIEPLEHSNPPIFEGTHIDHQCTPNKDMIDINSNNNLQLPSHVVHNVNSTTPAKERVKAALTKDFKSPKRKTTHPRRRSNPLDIQPRKETPLKVSGEQHGSLDAPPPCVSPLLEGEDFTQMLKAMFSNSTFQEQIADNINKVTAGDLGNESGPTKNVEEVVKQTTQELNISQIYAMLGDLNHYNDSTKKEMFFPTQSEIEHHDTDSQHQNLLKTAQEIVNQDSLAMQIETAQQQSCVRNLNSDLGVEANSVATTTQTHIPTTAPMTYQSQASYHNLDQMKKNELDLKTPTKVTFISANPQTQLSTRSVNAVPLQDSENIATDALLLLSTSPAKPPTTPQKDAFSFVKMLSEPLKEDLVAQSSSQSVPLFMQTQHVTTSAPTLSTQTLPSMNIFTSTSQPSFFEEPNRTAATTPRKLLPKQTVTQCPQQVLQPVFMNNNNDVIASSIAQQPSIYKQLNLKDSKQRRLERQRQTRTEKKNRQRKNEPKPQVVTRFLSFTGSTPNPLQPLMVTDPTVVTLNPQQNSTPLFNVKITESPAKTVNKVETPNTHSHAPSHTSTNNTGSTHKRKEKDPLQSILKTSRKCKKSVKQKSTHFALPLKEKDSESPALEHYKSLDTREKNTAASPSTNSSSSPQGSSRRNKPVVTLTDDNPSLITTVNQEPSENDNNSNGTPSLVPNKALVTPKLVKENQLKCTDPLNKDTIKLIPFKEMESPLKSIKALNNTDVAKNSPKKTKNRKILPKKEITLLKDTPQCSEVKIKTCKVVSGKKLMRVKFDFKSPKTRNEEEGNTPLTTPNPKQEPSISSILPKTCETKSLEPSKVDNSIEAALDISVSSNNLSLARIPSKQTISPVLPSNILDKTPSKSPFKSAEKIGSNLESPLLGKGTINQSFGMDLNLSRPPDFSSTIIHEDTLDACDRIKDIIHQIKTDEMKSLQEKNKIEKTANESESNSEILRLTSIKTETLIDTVEQPSLSSKDKTPNPNSDLQNPTHNDLDLNSKNYSIQPVHSGVIAESCSENVMVLETKDISNPVHSNLLISEVKENINSSNPDHDVTPSGTNNNHGNPVKTLETRGEVNLLTPTKVVRTFDSKENMDMSSPARSDVTTGTCTESIESLDSPFVGRKRRFSDNSDQSDVTRRKKKKRKKDKFKNLDVEGILSKVHQSPDVT